MEEEKIKLINDKNSKYIQDENNNISYDINNNNETSPKIISEFYENASIFITGSTGFLGKVLVEKLLRSCSGLKTIYLLLRPKRGMTSEHRFVEFVKNSIFDRIRSERPEVLDKLVYITGDVTQAHLGLSEKDIHELVHNVNIVFHVAATVRFNESLKDAANLNTIGTKRLLEICSKMENLQSLVHVSTAYSNPNRKFVGEQVYTCSSKLNSQSFLQCFEALPTDIIDLLADKIQVNRYN